MFSFRIGHTTVDFTLLIIIVFAALMIAFIKAVWLWKKNNTLLAACQSGDYQRSIAIANQLLKEYQRSYRIYRSKKTKNAIDQFNIFLAISYLGQSNNELFWNFINKAGEVKEKYFWLSIYYYLQDDIEKLKDAKAKILVNTETQKSIQFLNSILMYKDGKVEESKEMINKIKFDLKFVLLKNIAVDILSK